VIIWTNASLNVSWIATIAKILDIKEKKVGIFTNSFVISEY